MSLSSQLEDAEVLGILGLVVIIGYGLYKVYGSLGVGLTAAWNGIKGAASSVASATGSPLTSSVLPLSNDYAVPNTGGVTVGQLRSANWTDDQIGQFIDTYDPGGSQGVSGVADTIIISP